MSLTIRPVRPGEGGLVLDFVRELAAYEKLEDKVEATAAGFEASLFGPNPRVFCDIADWDGAPAGFALWFYNYSTFYGRHGIYLEDLFVRPDFRRYGIATALLGHLARRCLDEGLGRLDWAVLDWNAPAIAFYDRIGAVPLSEWLGRRLAGEALARLAAR
ncbi:GNAT family N-acetyltransferase [Ancylobacter terrae]|uniref:GNAT family N-acetyltransferase n=1 Tax=Ancylobacter sp. sgz301288 TaxID=3342077 RepID=UPI00385FA8B0